MECANSELKQVTFLTTQTSTGSKVDIFHQSQPLTQSSDVTHAVRVVKNVTCLSSLIILTHPYLKAKLDYEGYSSTWSSRRLSKGLFTLAIFAAIFFF